MFDIEELLSKNNQRLALQHLSHTNSRGPDGMHPNELPQYWKSNKERIVNDINNSQYNFGLVKQFEVLKNNGKRRTLCSINVIDRFIERLLCQKLNRYIAAQFLEHSYAYQAGKGVLDAAQYARSCIEKGCGYVVEIDIKRFFDNITHKVLFEELDAEFSDDALKTLLHKAIKRKISHNSKIYTKGKGLLQGSSISSVLSNFYLHPLDTFLQEQNYNWMRFADNICIYTENEKQTVAIFNSVIDFLKSCRKLKINEKKSGIYQALDRRVLGYDFYIINGKIDLRKHQYLPQKTYGSWHESCVFEQNRQYHIAQDGILTKKDYSILFENDDERHHIPVEITDQINIYNDVTISPAVRRLLMYKNIRVAFFSQYGNMTSVLAPSNNRKSAEVFLKQCETYLDTNKRVSVAKSIEIASIHNMRNNVRYYQKKRSVAYLKECGEYLSQCIVEVNESKDVEMLLLIEARARQKYYAALGKIIDKSDFCFQTRNKRPPKDPTNALISFGNTLLYNQFLQIIWKTSLDPKIGIVHATNRREYSLNLDFADIFKPIVVDRTIFSLINRHEIKANLHFRKLKDGAVLLNDNGKHIFIAKFQEKLHSYHKYKGQGTTYKQLMINEVHAFQRLLRYGEVYKPYKYY